MREGTVVAVYICKYLELIYLILIAALMISEGVSLMKAIGKSNT